MEPRALTLRGKGILKALITDVAIGPPFLGNEEKVKTTKVRGIWDTGANGSVITDKVVKALDLKPIGMRRVHTAGGECTQNEYLVNIILPSNVIVPNVRVTEGKITPDADMLIGMDIISLGDFSITNYDSQTVMSFCMPSSHEIDYVKEINYLKLPRSERRRMDRESKK